MKKFYFLLVFSVLFLLFSCEQEKSLQVKVQSEINSLDSIYIVEAITDRIIAKIPATQSNTKFEYNLEFPTIGVIKFGEAENKYLTTLTDGKEMIITIKANSSISTNNISDSLLNYLWHSNNNFISANGGIIFGSQNVDTILEVLEEFRLKREAIIDANSAYLTEDESQLLKYQNKARINSFLFYYGRVINQFPPEHPFFSFAEDIDNNNIWIKSLPNNILYKYEVEYLNKNGSLKSISSFKDYIEEKASNEDLSEFLKAAYLISLIETPHYWRKHEELFNSEVLKQEMEEEEDNTYYNLIEKNASSIFSAKKGEIAYNFTAEQNDGTKVKLSDFAGKVVFIDNWASWCMPCIAHRPRMLKLAKKYKGDPNVAILMISMDALRDNWLEFLNKNKEDTDHGMDLIIEDGMNKEYGKKFNVNFIPKYILIGRDGKVIDANIPAPSIAVETMIGKELNN